MAHFGGGPTYGFKFWIRFKVRVSHFTEVSHFRGSKKGTTPLERVQNRSTAGIWRQDLARPWPGKRCFQRFWDLV